LSVSALAAHEASFGEETGEGCHAQDLSPVSPRFFEWKARRETRFKRTSPQSKFNKKKTKEEIDAEFENVYDEMAEEITKQIHLEQHQYWAGEMLKHQEDKKNYGKQARSAAPYVDHILGVDWNEVQRGGEDKHKKGTQFQTIQPRLPRRLTLKEEALEAHIEKLPKGFGLNVEAPRSAGRDDESDSDEDFGDDSSASSGEEDTGRYDGFFKMEESSNHSHCRGRRCGRYIRRYGFSAGAEIAA
jgi:hypothetical protein